jgi:hypothetical protein
MCVPDGVAMYVAKHADYVVKRMPETGSRHHPTCQSFEPEPGISGLGELIGEAIVEHTPEQVEVRTAFPLCRMPGRRVPAGASTGEPPEVHAPRRCMSLRALLHFLYERAGFNRWYPAMVGRRNQGVIQKYLTEAAKGIVLKGAPLDERLYVPEPFRVELKEEIGERRRQKLALLLSREDAVQYKMAIVVGEYNGSESGTFGRKIYVKHMPDVPLHIEAKAWGRVERAYGATLQARDADVQPKPRVLLAALVYAKREHLYHVDTRTLMLVNEHWIPLEGLHEAPLMQALVREGRVFLKPMRYDARSAAGFANVLLLDSASAPVALHVVSAFAQARDRSLKDKTIASSTRPVWVWRTEAPMPEFPARLVRKSD